MLKSTEKLIGQGWQKHLIRDIDLQNVFDGTKASRYGLINKAMRAKELIQIRRGLYALSPPYYDKYYWSQYYIANHIVPYSFVTAESALSFHAWIPEQIKPITSAIAFGRNRTFHTPMGNFVYRFFPIQIPNYFFHGVESIKIGEHLAWIATPLRALIDYIYWHKIDNADNDFLMNSLRIDEDHLRNIKTSDVYELLPIYRSLRVERALKNMLKENNG